MESSAPFSCVIVGGGPAGLVLGLLLARAGIPVTVLEKHADFLRDFRGDTVHPSTLGLLEDLGLFERFSALPQSQLTRAVLPFLDDEVAMADFARLPVRHPYVAMVPQWDLLTLLTDAARTEPTFTLLMEHEVVGVVREGGRVVGVEYRHPEGQGRLLADLTIACDGRHSTIRSDLGLRPRTSPVGFDVWWYRIPTATRLADSLLPRAVSGALAVGIPRPGYLQTALLGPKGTDAALRARGIEALRRESARLFPELAADVERIERMDDVKRLDVRIDRLRRWSVPGALLIGDAAHAMSPVGGVGINLAVQDAVASARLIANPLRRRDQDLVARAVRSIQLRRTLPTIVVQGFQRLLHARVIMPALSGRPLRPPRLLVALLRRVPIVAIIPAALLGIGPAPERTPGWARRRPLMPSPSGRIGR